MLEYYILLYVIIHEISGIIDRLAILNSAKKVKQSSVKVRLRLFRVD